MLDCHLQLKMKSKAEYANSFKHKMTVLNFIVFYSIK